MNSENPSSKDAATSKREYDRRWYAKLSSEKKRRKIALQRERQVRNMEALRAYKAEAGCMDCGESDPIVLEFDHRDPSCKEDNVADAHKNGWSIERLMEEAKKCDVVCANCHRRRTAKDFWGPRYLTFISDGLSPN